MDATTLIREQAKELGNIPWRRPQELVEQKTYTPPGNSHEGRMRQEDQRKENGMTTKMLAKLGDVVRLRDTTTEAKVTWVGERSLALGIVIDGRLMHVSAFAVELRGKRGVWGMAVNCPSTAANLLRTHADEKAIERYGPLLPRLEGQV